MSMFVVCRSNETNNIGSQVAAAEKINDTVVAEKVSGCMG